MNKEGKIMRKKFLLSSLLVFSVILALGILTKPAAQAQGIGHEDVLIGFKKFPGKSEKAQVEKVGGKIKYTYHLIPVIAASIPTTAIKGLKHNPNVTYIEEDGDVFIAGEWTVSELADSWGVDRIDADHVWDNNDSSSKGAGVYVAIIDTGIDMDHPDLFANIAGGVNFVSGKGKDKAPDPDDWDDGHGHGSHCAGIVAADDNGFGVVGVAPDLRFNNVGGLFGVKVLDDRGRGKASDFIAGLQWAVDNGANVVSISLRMYGEGVTDACDAAYAAGLLLVSAAGNNWGGGVTGPANHPSVVAVSATGFDGVNDFFAEFSSDGPEVELAAPGVDVYSTYRNGGYTFMDGTSMACPHVAGVAALAWATGYYVNGSAVRFQLNRIAEWLDGLNSDQQGNGLVDAEAAVAFPESAVNFELSRDNYGYDITETAVLTAVVRDECGNPIIGLPPGAFETNLYDLSDPDPIPKPGIFIGTGPPGTYIGYLNFSELINGEYTETSCKAEVNVTDTQRGLSGIDEEIFWVVERTGSLSVLIEPLNYPPCYTIGDTIYVQVTVMDAGGTEVPGADVHVELNNAAGRYYLRDETTDEYGVAEFRFKTKKADGIGTYLIRVWASKSGYPSTYDEMEICVQ
jgi:subtilisin family serine protease